MYLNQQQNNNNERNGNVAAKHNRNYIHTKQRKKKKKMCGIWNSSCFVDMSYDELLFWFENFFFFC